MKFKENLENAKNPRGMPDTIVSSESGRLLYRGIKTMTITIDGHEFKYGQPGWWASLTDPKDREGQLTDEDNETRAAARREAKARARAKDKLPALTPLAIKAIREVCGLSQQDAARLFGGGAKAFEKYEAGEVSPSFSMVRILLLAAKHPRYFKKGRAKVEISEQDASLIRETIRKSSVERIYRQIYSSRLANEQEQTLRSSVKTAQHQTERLK